MLAISVDPEMKFVFDVLTTSGDGQAFDLACKYWELQLFKAILFPRQLFEEARYGTQGQSQTVADTFLLLLDLIFSGLGDVLTNQLIKRMIIWNRGEQDDYGEWVFEDVRPADLERLAGVFERVQRGLQSMTASGQGINPADEEKLRDVFGEVRATWEEAENARVAMEQQRQKEQAAFEKGRKAAQLELQLLPGG